MVWIKQHGGVGCRWVCSHCGTLFIRVQDDTPLPSRCDACGEENDGKTTRGELLKAMLDSQAMLADNIVYGRKRKKRAMWIIKEAIDERIVVQCSRCKEYLAVKGSWASTTDSVECPHCYSAMGGAVYGEESACADDTGCP